MLMMILLFILAYRKAIVVVVVVGTTKDSAHNKKTVTSLMNKQCIEQRHVFFQVDSQHCHNLSKGPQLSLSTCVFLLNVCLVVMTVLYSSCHCHSWFLAGQLCFVVVVVVVVVVTLFLFLWWV